MYGEDHNAGNLIHGPQYASADNGAEPVGN
jgi:hypothetical protein